MTMTDDQTISRGRRGQGQSPGNRNMLRLRGLTRLNTDLVTKVNEDVYDAGTTLLATAGFLIFEEAVIRAGQRRHRSLVQWRALRNQWQQDFGRDLLSLSRNNFRQLIHSDYEQLRVLRDVAAHLDRGNSNQQAGFGFPGWNRMITGRQIAARKHQAQSFDQ
jgi:hypothetical protein